MELSIPDSLREMFHHGGARGLGIIHAVELERCNDNAAHPAAHAQKLRHVNLMALLRGAKMELRIMTHTRFSKRVEVKRIQRRYTSACRRSSKSAPTTSTEGTYTWHENTVGEVQRPSACDLSHGPRWYSVGLDSANHADVTCSRMSSVRTSMR